MVKKMLLSGLGVILVFSLSGCATTRKDGDLQMQGLRNRVLALETQLREKEDEISSLREQSTVTSSPEVNVNLSKDNDKVQATAKQIQTALKNAGYYAGAVDGKAGKKTRKAVREFQKANNLPGDGKVGKKTWAVLMEYLEKKVK